MHAHPTHHLLRRWGALTLTCFLSLVTVDLLGGLELPGKLLFDPGFVGGLADLAGMSIVSLQTALALSLIGLAAARWLHRPRWPAPHFCSVAVASLAGLVAVHTRWQLSLNRWPGVLPLMLLLAVGTGMAIHFWRPPSIGARASWAESYLLITLPAVFVSQASTGLRHLLDREVGRAALCALVVLLAWGSAVGSRTRWRRLAPWLLPAAAVLLILTLDHRSRHLALPTVATAGNVPGPGPPVVLIVLDTLRADRLPLYGYPRATMPALTRWAERAVVAERAVSNAGWTAPSHASIFSGRTVSDHGIHHADSDDRLLSRPREGVDWLPAELARAGYRTLAVTANRNALPPGIEGFQAVLAPHRTDWTRGTIAAFFDRLPLPSSISGRSSGWRLPYLGAEGLSDLVLRSLPSASDPPFFLFVNYLDPHDPLLPPRWAERRLLGRSVSSPLSRHLSAPQLTLRSRGLSPEDRDRLQEAVSDLYDAELLHLDRELERFLAELERRFGDEVVTIVVSDHGEELGEQGRYGHDWGVPQSLIHVPLLVRAPWLESGRNDDLIPLRRLFPWIEAVASGEAPSFERLASDSGSTVAERYPCRRHERRLGPEYGAPWVTLLRSGHKAVGPSVERGWHFTLDPGSFAESEVSSPSEADRLLLDQVDLYWTEHVDRRDSSDPLTLQEQRSLRALGYLQ